jgi:hypothetical protein
MHNACSDGMGTGSNDFLTSLGQQMDGGIFRQVNATYNGHGCSNKLLQSTIPSHAKPFSIILYADKTRLSSFSTEKGYPVVARCANLPVSIRNGEGVGGGRLVGWLPIVRSDLNNLNFRQLMNPYSQKRILANPARNLL